MGYSVLATQNARSDFSITSDFVKNYLVTSQVVVGHKTKASLLLILEGPGRKLDTFGGGEQTVLERLDLILDRRASLFEAYQLR